MTKHLVIGFGNPLRSDDGLGWAAARHLQETISPTEATVVTLHQLTPELAEEFSTVEKLVFIDAASSGTPGEICTRRIEPDPSLQASNHFSDPAAILGMALDLYGHAPVTHVVSIVGWDFGYAETLTPEMQACVIPVAETALSLLGIEAKS